MNKKLKIALISVFTVFLGILLAIQSIPFFINGEQFKSTIYKGFEESTDLKLQVKKINLSGAPFLKAKITFDEPLVQTKKGEPIFYSQKASASINIIPLLLKQVQISDVKLISPDFYIVKEKSGKFNFERTSPPKPKKNNFKVITDGMDIFVKDYQIAFLDKTTPKPLDTKAKGKKIQISGLNSKFGTKITTDGALAINNIRCLNYDIKTEIDMPEFMKYQEEHPLTGMEESSPVNPLYEISRNCVRANLIADLKIKTPEDIRGEASLDKLSLKLNGKRLPDSHIKVKAKKDKFFADAKLYITPKGIIDLNGEFRKNFIDCKLKTSHMQLNEVQMFTNAVLASMGKPLNDLEKLKMQGDLFADLKLKSDMKTIKSSGFLKVNNAQINYNQGLLVIKSFNSNIKLNNNNIQFLNTGGIIDNNKFQINGNIDKNANANVKVIIPSLNIKSITENKDIKAKLTNISKIDGKVSAIILLTGKLDKLKYQGNITLNKMNLGMKNNPAKISFGLGKISLDGEKALLNIPRFNINKSTFELNGKIPIKDKEKKNPITLNAKGNLKASDLATLLNSGSIGHGEVPTICNVLIDKDTVKINLQILNDTYNNILIQGIGSNSLLSAHANIRGKTLAISDAGLFKTGKKSLSNDFDANLSGTTQIATATGSIQTIGNQKALEDIKIRILNPIKISLPIGKNTTSEITGNATISGTTKNPDIKGDFILLNTIVPDLKAKISKSTVSFNNKKITANILNFSSGKTGFNAQATINMKNTDPVIIENLNVNANTFNADEIFGLLGKMNPKKPQKVEYSLNKNNAMHLSPIVIKSGTVSAKVFILNDVPCYDLISNLTLDRYNIVKAENLSTATLKGTITGNVIYDMVTSVTSLDLKARGIDVGMFGEKFLNLPPGQIEGIGSSNMKLAFQGANSDEIVKSMHGALNLKVLNGEMGDLGRIDYYLRAANILSNNILSLSINRILNGVRLKRTGEFEQAYGHLTFIRGGIIRIDTFKTIGPRLSLVMKGYVNNINLDGSINVYGRLSEEVVGILGPLGDFSIEKALQKVPVLDTLTHLTIGLVETNVPDNIRADIPPLSIQGASSQEFAAKINGNVTKPSSVKTFRWIRENAG